MEWHGVIAPTDDVSANDMYRDLEEPARTVVSELLHSLDTDTIDQDAIDDVILTTVRNALFGSLLRVATGSTTEFEAWLDDQEADITVQQIGGEHVDYVAWHRFENEVVAATYQHEPGAARGTLRRYAFNRLYREILADIEPER